MKFLKSVSAALVAVVLIALALPVEAASSYREAPTYAPYFVANTNGLGGTNSLIGLTTTNIVLATATGSYYWPFTPNPDLRYYSTVTVQAKFNTSSTSGTGSNCVFTISGSSDGTNYAPMANLVIAGAGTAYVTGFTNITLGAIGYLRLDTISNPHATGALTNIAVWCTTKPNDYKP